MTRILGVGGLALLAMGCPSTSTHGTSARTTPSAARAYRHPMPTVHACLLEALAVLKWTVTADDGSGRLIANSRTSPMSSGERIEIVLAPSAAGVRVDATSTTKFGLTSLGKNTENVERLNQWLDATIGELDRGIRTPPDCKPR